jgi:hypothetical protein
VITDEYLDQYHHERIISINVDTIYNSNSIIDLGIMEDEVSCWVSLIKLHCNDSMLKDIDLVKLKDFINNNSDDESMSIDDSIFSASSRHDYNKMSYNDAEKIIEMNKTFESKLEMSKLEDYPSFIK